MSEAVVTFAAVLVVGIVLYRLLKREKEAGTSNGGQPVKVGFDETRVWVSYSNGDRRTLAWSDLTAVGIRTTSDGPLADDVFWGLHGSDGKPAILYAGRSDGERALLEELQRRLPGFNNERLIEAMGSTSDAFFLLWGSLART